MPRTSTDTPIGCVRPPRRLGEPSHERNQTSSCETEFRPKRTLLYTEVSVTTPSDGHVARSPASSELYTRVIGEPSCWSPRGSMKKAPMVSPAHANPALDGITAPSCRPELKM